jgi:hypothetical protein
LLHEALVALSDEEAALRVALMATVLVSDEAQRGREELGLHEGCHVGVVEVAPWAPESPGGRVVRARG